MDSIENKIAGWALLVAGVLIIFWSMYSSFEVFTGKSKAPEIFAAPLVSEKTQNSSGGNSKVEKIDPAKLQTLNPADLAKLQEQQQAQMQDALSKEISSQFEKLIPSDLISKIMNLSSWSMFAFIMIYAGSKISGLGIKLLKN